MCALIVRCLVVHSRIDHSIAVEVVEVAAADAIAVVVAAAAIDGQRLILQPAVGAAAADGVVVVVDDDSFADVHCDCCMLSLLLVDAVCEVVDYLVVRSYIVAPAQWGFVVNALVVVPDMMITIQQLMSLKNIQIHCLESGPTAIIAS